jgi:SAM-dependent methyltransferase
MLKKIFAELAMRGAASIRLTKKPSSCPVCDGTARSIGAVDFNRTCEDSEQRVFARSDKLVDYFLCERCDFMFSPEFLEWSEDRFLREIYNEEYLLVDPEFPEIRPRRMAKGLEEIFGGVKREIHHLDYGSGYGTLSKLLEATGWQTNSYDPFFKENSALDVEKFDLVTAIEVFEHVPFPYRLMDDLVARLRPDGVLYFSTLLSDGVQCERSTLDWWYLAPRNGHISLFSMKSLTFLLDQYSFKLANVSPGFFLAYRKLPQWCKSIELFSTLRFN